MMMPVTDHAASAARTEAGGGSGVGRMRGSTRSSALPRQIRAENLQVIWKLTCCSATVASQPTFG